MSARAPADRAPRTLRRVRAARIRGLYGMADAGFGDPAAIGRALLQAGCSVVQLRCKGWPSAAIAAVARGLRPLAEAHDALLIVNDDEEAALASGAHGLHLGQADGDLGRARARQPELLLGRSTHDLRQVREALREGVDYLGFGPVFPTRTKADADPTVGLDGLGAALALLREAGPEAPPLVAIGGIERHHLPALRALGVPAWAVISGLLGAPPADLARLPERAADFLVAPLSSRQLSG